MKPFLIACAVAAIVVLTLIGLYNSGFIGITEEKINQEQKKTVSWDSRDYTIRGTCADDSALYVGIMYMKDYSDARYFIYIDKSGWSFGWHFLRSGSLTDIDGLREFNCGEYGKAYVALNAEHDIQRIEFDDGREPTVTENTNYPIVEQSKNMIRFYDKSGNLIEPSVIKVAD